MYIIRNSVRLISSRANKVFCMVQNMTLLLLTCLLLSCSAAENRIVSRHEIFAVNHQISEIEANITDENRCDSERKMSRLLESVCTNCFDGWGMTSYSIDEVRADCVPSKLPPECLEEPRWIAQKSSSCGTCGITYSAVNVQEFFLPRKPSEDISHLMKPISCEEFYQDLAKKKKYCGNCLKIVESN